jgi:hypothetical protein
MWTLSGFADEISPDLEMQCATLDDLGIGHIEVRSVWDVNVLDLDDDQLDRVREAFEAHRIHTSSIGSPIGKIAIGEKSTGMHRRTGRWCARSLGAGWALSASFRPDPPSSGNSA